MSEWHYKTDGNKGIIYTLNEVYPFEIAEGQIQVHLPFMIDKELIRNKLEEEGFSMTDDEEFSQGWGEGADEDNYYPCWVWVDTKNQKSILAFPPQDYTAAMEDGLSNEKEPIISHEPIFGKNSMEEFTRWIEYVKSAAIDRY